MRILSENRFVKYLLFSLIYLTYKFPMAQNCCCLPDITSHALTEDTGPSRHRGAAEGSGFNCPWSFSKWTSHVLHLSSCLHGFPLNYSQSQLATNLVK